VKPDVVALGVQVYGVDSEKADGYRYHRGTSYSCPLVSGACALLLEAHPEWGPYEIGEALRSTATDLGPVGPDTLYGWGIVNAAAAGGLSIPPVVRSIPDGKAAAGDIYTVMPSATGSTPITWSLVRSPDAMTVASATGTVTWAPTAEHVGSHTVTLSAENAVGVDSVSWTVWVYAPVTVARFGSPYPNPSRSGAVSFPFDLPSDRQVSVRIYTMAGELVWEDSRRFGPGPDALPWNNEKACSRAVGSGIYLYRISCGPDEKVGKIAVVR
jgi:hypothetical protein